ncbi:solute carrier family 35 member [Nesidiocoris tenuis]|uniref:Solute carrier family 35 member n=1 Tax=Nesidiocoris tenuis TaxID=355587 RepID=A0ABN7AHI1_9HEMI|nr:solute carrier family 35 member [Nesidiocoris tenuis]
MRGGGGGGAGGDIPTIFNPHRVRAPPNLVVTSDGSPRSGTVPNGPFSRQQSVLQHNDSVTGSTQDAPEPAAPPPTGPMARLRRCTSSCCSDSARKFYCGVCVTVLVTASWVGTTHCIKYMYIGPPRTSLISSNESAVQMKPKQVVMYNAPFFTTWFCTNWTVLFFPIYFVCQLVANKCKSSGDILTESIRNFREKGFTLGKFMTRVGLFCLLWVITNYMYIHSLRILQATEAMALFATNVACVYFLSWIILHKQFVGVRIVAVILCDMGTALLAYMDGITRSPTLCGVVLAAAAAAGSAVYKVLFKKVIGDASYGQVAMFFSLIGLFNAVFLWPLSLALYFMGAETIVWDYIPWPLLFAAGGLSLVTNLLGNFGVAWTYDLFITLGLITAVPVSAALDVVFYHTHFFGMKLAGMILIAIGFFLVMFPDNWPTYITRLLRNIVLLSHSARWSRRGASASLAGQPRPELDYRTGLIRSHLRSPSGRVR